jgi:hypothetical protein
VGFLKPEETRYFGPLPVFLNARLCASMMWAGAAKSFGFALFQLPAISFHVGCGVNERCSFAKTARWRVLFRIPGVPAGATGGGPPHRIFATCPKASQSACPPNSINLCLSVNPSSEATVRTAIEVFL